MMPDERLEFSAQDLGRLAFYADNLPDVLEWLDVHGSSPDEMRRVREACIAGYLESSGKT